MICEKCNRELDEKKFYRGRQNQCYSICKTCLKEGELIDPEEPTTYLPILKQLDYPYFKEYWYKQIRSCSEKFGSSYPGTAVLGRYIAYMKLHDFAYYTWKDNKRIEEEYQK